MNIFIDFLKISLRPHLPSLEACAVLRLILKPLPTIEVSQVDGAVANQLVLGCNEDKHGEIYTDGISQDYGNSRALAMELSQSCAQPSIYCIL